MATVPFKPYGPFAAKVANKEIDLDSDVLKMLLLGSSYTPNLDTHDYANDLTNELSTGGGYTSGGLTLAGVTCGYVAANSWSAVHAVSTAYAVGDTRRPSTGNGFLYKCVVAGTSSGTAPTWPTTVGLTVTDGSVTWACMGHGAVVLDCNDPSWATFTAGPFRYAAVVDTSPGSSATNPLVCLGDFGSDQTGAGGAFTVVIPPEGLLLGFVQ